MWGPLAGYFAPRSSAARARPPSSPDVDIAVPAVRVRHLDGRDGAATTRCAPSSTTSSRAVAATSTRILAEYGVPRVEGSCDMRSGLTAHRRCGVSAAARSELDPAVALRSPALAGRPASARRAASGAARRRADRQASVRVGQLQPGGAQPEAIVTSPYQDNAWGMGEGKRLYGAFNCARCHGVNGGGAIGPPLMDDKWIYGGARRTRSTRPSRRDGPTACRRSAVISEPAIWQLVAYVRSDVGPDQRDRRHRAAMTIR